MKKRAGEVETYLEMAKVASKRSTCTRRQVGAVVVNVDGYLIGHGYNGAVSGQKHCVDGGCPRGKMTYDEVEGLGDYDRVGSPSFCVAVHAEANALLHCGGSPRGGKMFVSEKPCPNCRKLMASAGIMSVAWPDGSLYGYDIVDFEKQP